MFIHIIMFSFLKFCFGMSNNNKNNTHSLANNKTIGSQQRCKKCTCKTTKPKKSEDIVFPPFFHDFI